MTAKPWKAWPPKEEALLKSLWGNGQSAKRIAARFPGRSAASVIKHGYDMGLGPRDCGREGFSPVWVGAKLVLKGGKLLTAREIATALNVTPHAVQQCMRERHGTEVHIGGYANVAHASQVNRWKLGPGPDAPLPARKTKKEVNRDYWRRMSKDPEFCARQNMLARRRYAEKTGKLIRRDPAAAWIPSAPRDANHTTTLGLQP
jgi:hypothetical protein